LGEYSSLEQTAIATVGVVIFVPLFVSGDSCLVVSVNT